MTLKDVALRANVSATTASLFFNGREDVCSKSTAVRLRQAAADLQYPADRGRRRGSTGSAMNDGPRASRSTRSASSEPISHATTAVSSFSGGGFTVGVGIPHNAVPDAPAASVARLGPYPETFLEKVWRGIRHVADIEDCRILHYPRRTRDGDSIDPFLQESRVSGVIMPARANDARPGLLAAAGVPVVVVGRSKDIPEGCGAAFTLESDTVDLAMSHLWQLGHRRIAHLTGPVTGETDIRDEIARRRLDRYSAWTQIRGVYDPRLIFYSDRSEDRMVTVADALPRMMSMPNPPTAIFCTDDAIAVAACRRVKEMGLRVPTDVSIVGVDNSVYGAEHTPSLSSVDVPYEEIGIQAVVQLTRLLEGAHATACRMAIAVTNFVARESTGPPP